MNTGHGQISKAMEIMCVEQLRSIKRHNYNAYMS